MGLLVFFIQPLQPAAARWAGHISASVEDDLWGCEKKILKMLISVFIFFLLFLYIMWHMHNIVRLYKVYKYKNLHTVGWA